MPCRLTFVHMRVGLVGLKYDQGRRKCLLYVVERCCELIRPDKLILGAE